MRVFERQQSSFEMESAKVLDDISTARSTSKLYLIFIQYYIIYKNINNICIQNII